MYTATRPVSRGFYIGLAIGQFWLALISTSFVAILWVLAQTAGQIFLILAAVVLAGLLLLGASLLLLRDALRLPPPADDAEAARSREQGKKSGRRFALIVLAEIVIIGAINVLLGLTNHGDWVVPVTFGLVGLHFIPLALVFQVRPYIVLGLLWIIVILLTLLLTPASLNLGQGISAWILIPIAGCGLATWLVLIYVLATSLKKVRAARHLSATTSRK